MKPSEVFVSNTSQDTIEFLFANGYKATCEPVQFNNSGGFDQINVRIDLSYTPSDIDLLPSYRGHCFDSNGTLIFNDCTVKEMLDVLKWAEAQPDIYMSQKIENVVSALKELGIEQQLVNSIKFTIADFLSI